MRRALLSLPLLLTAACSSLPAAEAPAWRRWSAAHGGVLAPERAGAAYERADAALARIATACACTHVTVRVLRDREPAAFAFRDGSLFVTRGLVALLDDGELSAALAHEVGHLSGSGDALPGPEAERLADRIGAELLRASGLSAALMPRMLRRLEAVQGSADIAGRIAALEAAPAPGAQVARAD